MEKQFLLEMKKEIEPLAKFWSQNSLFLFFGLSSAIFLTAGFELFRIIGKDYMFKWENISSNLIHFSSLDYYFIGTILFFLFGLILALISARRIDKNTKHFNKILISINKELYKKCL